MSVVLEPNYTGALVQHLITALPAVLSALSPPIVLAITNIRANLDGLSGNRFAIAVVKAGGPPADWDARLANPRLDLHIYGPTDYEADRLYRAVRWLLEPADGRAIGFTAALCRVTDVRYETSHPLPLPDGDWSRVIAPVVLRARMIAV